MLSKDMKKAIIAGICTSFIVLILIQPFINIIRPYFLNSTLKMLRDFNESVFSNAALGQYPWLIVHIYRMICIVLITFYFIFALSSKSEDKVMKEKTVYSLLKDKFARFITSKVVMIALGIWIAFCLSQTLILANTGLQLNASFEQRLTVLSSVIDASQIKDLRASWASMKSRKDYFIIVDKMDSIAKDINITLPPLLMDLPR